MKNNTKVRMNQKFKEIMIANDCKEHIDEFGDCIGLVQGPMIGPDGEEWPEYDVRWQPSNLRYGYHPDHLEIVDG